MFVVKVITTVESFIFEGMKTKFMKN